MQIATWNVNSIRTRQKIVANWLTNNPVDVLCLQETKVRDEQFPNIPFQELGYHISISGQKAYNGVALLSRQPLKNLIVGFSPILGEALVGDYDTQKRVISGVVDNIRIINLYVPNGSSLGSDKYTYKLVWLDLLRQYLQKLQTKDSLEICICGDFNIALEDKDIHNSRGKAKHIMSSPPERAALKNILDLGFQDAFRKFNSETGHFSWWDYRSGGFAHNRGWRIDHHYLSAKLYQQATNCWIDIKPRKLEKPSDHAPVILDC